MPAKIRLQRKGKKGQPYYHIVIADGRAPRDGRFIEKIGVYNPLAKPAEIDINFEKALNWLQNGAQPTDTVRAILSYKGILYKYHLLKGVKKGAMTQEQAEAKFETWNSEKLARIASARNQHILGLKEEHKKQMAEEAKVNEAKAAAIARKLAKAAEAAAESAAETAEAAETEALPEPPAEEPAGEPKE